MNDQQTVLSIQKAQQGDQEALEQFVKQNSGLVWSLVNRFKTQQNAQDLFQIGCIGLMKAIYNFDFSYDVMFSTYAVPIILGEIKKYFRDEGSMRVSRSLKERYIQVIKAKEQLFQTLQKEPTYQDIATFLELDVSDVMLAFEANQFLASMDEVIYDDSGTAIKLEDRVSKEGNDILLQISLKEELGRLDERERMLIYLRYDVGLNQEKIAKKMGMTQVQVSRFEKKILEKLKSKLE